MSVVRENGCTVITGKDIEKYRLLIAIQGLETHVRTNGRMRLSRFATPKRCMEIVSEFTRKKYKRSDARKAVDEGRAWLAEATV
jgi:hypothetical protein